MEYLNVSEIAGLIAVLVILLVAFLPKERSERVLRLVSTVLRLLPITAMCQALASRNKTSESK